MAIWAPNSVEWIVAVLGLSLAGAVLVPINTRFKGGEAADILSRSRARALVTVTDFLGTDYVAMLRATGADLPDLDTIVVAGGTPGERTDRIGPRSSRGPQTRRGPRSTGGAPTPERTIHPTSSSRRGRRACPRAW